MPTPEIPNLDKVADTAAAEEPTVLTTGWVQTPPYGEADGPWAPAPADPTRETENAPEADAQGSAWGPERVVALGLMALFAVFAVGLVISLGRWDVLDRVPFIPWLVGAALVAGPAWKSYSDMADDARASRARAERAKTAYGVRVTPPIDRHQG